MTSRLEALNTILRVLGVIFILTFLSMGGVPFDEPVVFVIALIFTVCIIGVTDHWFRSFCAGLRRRKR